MNINRFAEEEMNEKQRSISIQELFQQKPKNQKADDDYRHSGNRTCF